MQQITPRLPHRVTRRVCEDLLIGKNRKTITNIILYYTNTNTCRIAPQRAKNLTHTAHTTLIKIKNSYSPRRVRTSPSQT